MTELVSSVAEKVIEKLGSIVYQEICLAWGVESDLKNLEDTMSAIQVKLLDAEERQAKERGISLWLGKLKDVLYDAVDVLDEFECEALRKQVVKTYGSTGKKVRRFFSCSNPLAFRFKMGHRMKEIRERLEGIKKLSDQYNLQERQLDHKHIVVRETHSFIPDSDVIGRDKDKQKIIDLLMQPGDDGNVSVIPIVGLGGMGKTTLAQSVYNDEMVKSNFHPRVWVCVSEDFDVKRLAKEILKSADGVISENMSMDKVQIDLRETLRGKKYLLVLDDVWNEDRSEWKDLKMLLIEGAKGSKIIVTTRSHKVASVMTLGSIHELKGLPEQDCLCLFLKWAFEKGKDKQYPKLVEIGKDIVEKCRGVPLAVKTLGSLLYSKIEERDWISIRDNEIWKLEQTEKDILPALRLSYNKLPSYLKQCFAYCSLYPKDFRYYNEELIQCWMANGLLKKSNESTEEFEELEDIGERYLKELLSRSFFQEVKNEGNNFWSFKMHDLLHDLSLSIAQNHYCLIAEDTNKTKTFEKARHVSILDQKLSVDAVTTLLHKLSNKMQTVNFSFKDWVATKGPGININESLAKTCILRFKHLRLLNLRCSKLETLSSSIGTLKQLRYLNLRENRNIKKLPDSICDLQNLETLILCGCSEIEELPRDIRKMVSLRHFEITTRQTRLPANGIECMSSLQHLLFSGCPKLECLPQGMKRLTALKSLKIMNCLKLNLMEGDDYPTRLQELTVWELPRLKSLPQGLKGSASTLQFLHIADCDNLAVLPEWLLDLSSLRRLQIWYCLKLSSLPEGMDRLTALEELQIDDCPDLRRDYDREVGKDWGKMVKFSFGG